MSKSAPVNHVISEDNTNYDKGLIQRLINSLNCLLGRRNSERANIKEALEEALEDHENYEGDDALSNEEKDMLLNVLSFGGVTVRDVMIPRSDIAGVEIDTSLDQIKQIFQQERHTRMPVYQGDLDNITGFIHLKDMMPLWSGDKPFDLSDITRKIMFIPPSMRLVDLLLEMRVSGEHIALVVDEYGGTDGLVTMEDLFEEIVGEIQDEHDADDGEPEWHLISNGVYNVDARCEVDDLEDQLNIKLAIGEEGAGVDTIGGLLFLLLGRVPARGELIQISEEIKAEVLDVDARRIRLLRIYVER